MCVYVCVSPHPSIVVRTQRSMLSVCLTACHLLGPTEGDMSHWVVGITERAVERNGERSFFLHLFEQSWPALHVPVGLAPELGSSPRLFPSSHCPPFFFYTCFSKVAFSPTALPLAYIQQPVNSCLLIVLMNGNNVGFKQESLVDNGSVWGETSSKTSLANNCLLVT